MFWSNNFKTNDTKLKINVCFIFWLVQNFEFISISMSNGWSKLKDPVMHTQSELFDGCGTHAYVFASYPWTNHRGLNTLNKSQKDFKNC